MKKTIVSSVSVSFSVFAPGPLNLIFANQFKRITQVKLRVVILKVAN